MEMISNEEKITQAVLVSVDTGDYDAEASLAELKELVKKMCIRDRPSPSLQAQPNLLQSRQVHSQQQLLQVQHRQFKIKHIKKR